MSFAQRVREVRHSRLDAVSYLSWYVVAAFAIESRYVVGPLGGAATPAQLVAVAGLGWWLYFHTARTTPHPVGGRPRVQPVRIALLVFCLSYVASYVIAMSRPITAAESSGATLGVVGLTGWLGLALLAHDGIPDHDRFEILVRRLVLAGTLLAALGVAQFVFHAPLIRWFTIPGLTTNVPLGDLLSRSGFTRPSGTALHPIEFGAVLTIVLPLAIAAARTNPVGRRLWARVSVFVILLGVVVSGSRSAFLSTIVAVVVMAAVWSPATRVRAAAAGLGLIGFVAIAFPGVSGNMMKLFSGFGDDGSIESRTGSYAIVGEFVGRSPWLGRGGSTFLPSYRILDNQYLLTLVELGVVGLLALLGLFLAAFLCARAARLAAATPAQGEQAQAVAAAVAAAATGLATYDGMSFAMGTGVLFLVLGLAGAAWRLAREERSAGERHLVPAGSLAPRARAGTGTPRARRLAHGSAALALVGATTIACASQQGSDGRLAPAVAASETVRPAEARHGWPNAETTGASGHLRTRDGDVEVTEDGTTLRNLRIRGQVTIRADDVTVENVRVETDSIYGILVWGSNAEIVDTTIVGGRGDTLAGLVAYEDGSFHALRIDVSGSEDGVRLADHCTLRRSFIHGLRGTSSSHYDAVTADGYRGWRIVGNRILNAHDQTAAVWVGDPRYEPSSGVLRHNLLAGGGYTVYGGPGTGQGIRVLDNHFSTVYHRRSGLFGPVTAWVREGNTWSGNVWHDGSRRGRTVRP